MRRIAAASCLCWLLLPTPQAAAQQPHVESLATLFEDVYGPNGLVLNSDDVQLDGTNHAAHFNSAFQSDFRLVNIALTSQLTRCRCHRQHPGSRTSSIPRPAHSCGRRAASVRSFPIAPRQSAADASRSGSLTSSSRSIISMVSDSRPFPQCFVTTALKPAAAAPTSSRRTNTIESTVSQFTGALTYGITDRVDVSLAVPVVRTRLSLLSNATIYRLGTGTNVRVHYFRDDLAIGGYGSTHQYFIEGSASGIGDLLVRAKATMMREGPRAFAAGVDVRVPTGDEQNLLGAGAPGVRPFAAFSASYRAFAPHANISYQWNGRSVLAGDVRDDIEAPLPDQFLYAVGSDFSVNNRFSIVFDVLGQRVLDSPRLSTYTLAASGAAGSADLPDIRFANGSYWSADGALGFKANVAAHVLVDFNLRFSLGQNGLSDRIAPLIGVEWAF